MFEHEGKKLLGAFLALACVLFSAPTAAQVGSVLEGSPVDVHGFVSQGFIKTTKNNYLAESERGSFEFTEVGINFTKLLTDRLRIGVQLFARDLGPIGDYKPQFDWFYLDYRFEDWFGVRAGRTKLPFGLYNETNDIDAARVPVLLPQSVYPTENRDFLLAQTGVELYGDLPLGDAGQLEYRAYGGTVFLDTSSSREITFLEVPYLFGGRLMWQTPLEGLQLGPSVQKLRLDLEFTPDPELLAPLEAAGLLPPDFSGTVFAKVPALLWVGSVEYAAQDFLFAAEYSRWHVDVESSLPILFPESETISERYYAMISYRVASWFTPGVYYSVLFEDVDDRSAPGGYQHDVAVTARYDLTANWLFKIEGHFMHGTAALNSDLNDGQSLDTLEQDWALLLLKTTAFF